MIKIINIIYYINFIKGEYEKLEFFIVTFYFLLLMKLKNVLLIYYLRSH